jgi:hypothetical protein
MKFSSIKHNIKNNPGFKSLKEIREARYRIVKERDGDRYFLARQEELKPLLVMLGDIAEVRRGFTTGCNEFFYLPSKHFDIRKDGKYYELIPKYEGLPKGMRIEEEYLRPAIISPRDSQKISISKMQLKRFALICHDDKRHLSNKSVLEYIEWGEKQNFHKRPSCSSRGLWWNLGDRVFGEILWPMIHNERQTVFLSNKEIVVDHNLFEILTEDKGLIWTSLMASYQIMIRELFGRANLGEGALKTEGVDIKRLLVIPPMVFSKNQISNIRETIDKLNLRQIESCYKECGINPRLPIRDQTPNPLPDRKALDDVVFDILGLTQDERNEVYWSVCELVRNRLEKARSV